MTIYSVKIRLLGKLVNTKIALPMCGLESTLETASDDSQPGPPGPCMSHMPAADKMSTNIDGNNAANA